MNKEHKLRMTFKSKKPFEYLVDHSTLIKLIAVQRLDPVYKKHKINNFPYQKVDMAYTMWEYMMGEHLDLSIEVLKLKDICKIKESSGSLKENLVSSPSKNPSKNQRVPYVRFQDFGFISPSNVLWDKSDCHIPDAFMQDLIIVSDGDEMGRVNIVYEECKLANNIISLSCDQEKVIPEYLWLVITNYGVHINQLGLKAPRYRTIGDSFGDELILQETRSKQELDLTWFSNTEVALPDLLHQQLIATRWKDYLYQRYPEFA